MKYQIINLKWLYSISNIILITDNKINITRIKNNKKRESNKYNLLILI